MMRIRKHNKGHCIYYKGGKRKFISLIVPMLYPLVLLVKVSCRKCRALGRLDGKVKGRGLVEYIADDRN
jgi:hypothetical protein